MTINNCHKNTNSKTYGLMYWVFWGAKYLKLFDNKIKMILENFIRRNIFLLESIEQPFYRQ